VEDYAGEPIIYKPAAMPPPATSPLTALPCGVCPAFLACKEGAPVSPQTCLYFKEWLKFEDF
jgi:DNA-directed RNA polymerase III subunit RPC6